MASDQNSPKVLGKPLKVALDEMLDFGPPNPSTTSPDTTQRLLALVQKIKEMNARIDRLANNF